MKRNIAMMDVAIGLAAITGCSAFTGGSGNSTSSTATLPACAPKSYNGHYVGLPVPGSPPNTVNLISLEQAVGINANTVSIYMSLGSKIDMAALASLCGQGVLPVIEVELPIHFSDRAEGKSKMSLKVQLESAMMPFKLRRYVR